jgi:hypothetical protein
MLFSGVLAFKFYMCVHITWFKVAHCLIREKQIREFYSELIVCVKVIYGVTVWVIYESSDNCYCIAPNPPKQRKFAVRSHLAHQKVMIQVWCVF